METVSILKMEDQKSLNSRDPPSNRLTPLTVLRGVTCVLVLFLTAFMMLVYVGFVAAVILRFFSIHYSRKITSFFFGAWLALWPFLFEKINKTKVVFSGTVFQRGRSVFCLLRTIELRLIGCTCGTLHCARDGLVP